MCSVFFSVCRNLNASGREGFWTSKFLWLFSFFFFCEGVFLLWQMSGYEFLCRWLVFSTVYYCCRILLSFPWFPIKLLLSLVCRQDLLIHMLAVIQCEANASNIFIFVLFNGKITLKLVWKLHLFWGSTGYCMPDCYFIRSAGNGLTSYHCFCI